MGKENKTDTQSERRKDNLKPQPDTGLVSIDIKNIFRVLAKRKWWFIATFLIVFCVIFCFTYFVTPESKYSIHSSMFISTDNIKYQEKINYYFPKEAYDLWMIANEEYPLNSLNYYYMDANSYIHSDKVIDDAYEKLKGSPSKDILKKAIIANKSFDGTQLNISISYKNKDDTKKIADAILSSFMENREKDFEDSYNGLLKKTCDKITDLENEVSSLLGMAEDYSIEFNKKIIDELKDANDGSINFYVSDYIPPDIKVKLDVDNDQLANLKDIKSNLEEYKSLYIDRIVLNTGNETVANINLLKNIVLSLAAGVIFGLIFAFAADYFKSN